jgi:hypothetical protein
MTRNRGKPKPSLRDLSITTLSGDELIKWVKSLRATDPPIVVAITLAAILEHELDALLRPRISRNNDDTWRLLTSENGPLRSFFTKILMGYALKIYDNEIKAYLDIIRNVRNAFAHARGVIDFDNELIVKELSKIKPPAKGKTWLRLGISRAISAPSGKASYIILGSTLLVYFQLKGAARTHAHVSYLRRKERRLANSS